MDKVEAIEKAVVLLTRQDTRGKHFSEEFSDEVRHVLGIDLTNMNFVGNHYRFHSRLFSI